MSKQLESKNVLLVGGAGYIGSHVAKSLRESGYIPVIYDNLSTGFRELVKDPLFYFGSCSDSTYLEGVLKKYNPVCVIHLAGSAYVGESYENPSKYYNNNVVETIHLLDSMKATGCNKIVFSSSCATYGGPKRLPITEDEDQNPINPYGRTKLMIEKIIQDYGYSYGFNYVFLRYFNAAGADESMTIGEMHSPETHLIPLVLEACAKNSVVKIFGTQAPTKDGTCVRDYVHVNDLASAHVKSVKHIEYCQNGIYNLGANTASVLEIISMCEKVTGKKVQIEKLPGRVGDPFELYADARKAGRELNWYPKYDLETTIRTAWNWYNR